jgi:Ni/Fe-hydrogenase subunit HybB-like protein
MAYSSFVFLVARSIDLVVRGEVKLAFETNWYAVLFHFENLLVFVPALVLMNERQRSRPRVLFVTAAVTAIGGLIYRFSPTTLAFRHGTASIYFPSLFELLMCIGYIGLAIALFIAAAKYFAILPDQFKTEDK